MKPLKTVKTSLVLGLGVLGLALTALPIAVLHPPTQADAATFGQEEVNSNRFIILAIPRSTNAHSLLILEQQSNARPCWRVRNDAYQTVDPLLLNFNFKGICNRSTDSNSFSIRTAGQDLALKYTLRIIYQNNQAVLVGTPRDRTLPELELGRTRGIVRDFMKIDLNPGWRLTRRTFKGTPLGHLYLTNNLDLATLSRQAIAQKPPSSSDTVALTPPQPTPPPLLVPVPVNVPPPVAVETPTPAPVVTVPVVRDSVEFQVEDDRAQTQRPTPPKVQPSPSKPSPAPVTPVSPFPKPSLQATGPIIPETRPGSTTGLYAPRVIVPPSPAPTSPTPPQGKPQTQQREQQTQALQQMYREVLGRDADAAGLSYYLAQLDRGRTLDDIRRNMEISPEAQQRKFQAKPSQPILVPQPEGPATVANTPLDEPRTVAPNQNAYFAVVPTSSENLPRLAQRIRQLGANSQTVQQRGNPRGPHVAVGPFADRAIAERWSSYLRSNGLDARVYFGR